MSADISTGVKQRKASFFVDTKTPLERGYKFLTGDRPAQQTFLDLIVSVPFFTESESRAKEDGTGTGDSFNKEDLQGLVIAASDKQVLEAKPKIDTATYCVQPSQVTQASGGSSESIGSTSGGGLVPYDGPVMDVSQSGITTHRQYVIESNSSFLTWFGALYDKVVSNSEDASTALDQIETNKQDIATLNDEINDPSGGVAQQVAVADQKAEDAQSSADAAQSTADNAQIAATAAQSVAAAADAKATANSDTIDDWNDAFDGGFISLSDFSGADIGNGTEVTINFGVAAPVKCRVFVNTSIIGNWSGESSAAIGQAIRTKVKVTGGSYTNGSIYWAYIDPQTSDADMSTVNRTPTGFASISIPAGTTGIVVRLEIEQRGTSDAWSYDNGRVMWQRIPNRY